MPLQLSFSLLWNEHAVQFVREFLCCLKDWHLGPSFFYNPLQNRTCCWLELIIACLQMYPVVHEIYSGIVLLQTATTRLWRIQAILVRQLPLLSSSSSSRRHKTQSSNDNNNNNKTTISEAQQRQVETLAKRLVLEQSCHDGRAAIRDCVVGVQCVFLGIGWFWLVAHNLHISETTYWLGGLAGLVHAHTTMLLCLVVLLYFMIVDGRTKIRTAQRMVDVTMMRMLHDGRDDTESMMATMTLETFRVMNMNNDDPWEPFWRRPTTTIMPADGTATASSDERMMTRLLQEEINNVQRSLRLLLFQDDDDVVVGRQHDGTRPTRPGGQPSLVSFQKEALRLRLEGYRDFCYFVLNFVAFYGYTLGILTYYFHDNNNEPQQYWLTMVKFGLPHADAEWWGNFAGDLMWTIEPLVVLFSPGMFQSILDDKKITEQLTTTMTTASDTNEKEKKD